MTIKGCLEIIIQIKSKGYLFIFKCTITIQSMNALLFSERVFDSSCSYVSAVSCIFYYYKKDTAETRVQKFHRRVKCPTRIQYRYSTPNEVSMLPIFKLPFNSYKKNCS